MQWNESAIEIDPFQSDGFRIRSQPMFRERQFPTLLVRKWNADRHRLLGIDDADRAPFRLIRLDRYFGPALVASSPANGSIVGSDRA
jgi:hypothetical protein